jgi:glycosyltransferase involved in cell wall biosynthesis
MKNTQTVPIDQEYRYTFTVFTPSYNRAHTLDRVYESLKAQTYRDFEWLIVDDGSTDNTRQLVEQWQQENIFPIRYIYQENGHKHIAFKRGVQEADGELFLTLDSDDSCEPQALERFKYHWDNIPLAQKAEFSAVTCLCKSIDGKIIGDLFPADPTDSNSLEMRYKFKAKGEKWGFHRTEVLRGISFYEQIKGFHVPESVFWNQIAIKYQTRYVNEALRIYQDDQESIMRNVDNPSKSALGLHLQYLSVLNQEMGWFRFDPLQLVRSAVHYSRFSFHLGNKINQQIGDLQPLSAKILCLITLPIGYLAYRKDQ